MYDRVLETLNVISFCTLWLCFKCLFSRLSCIIISISKDNKIYAQCSVCGIYRDKQTQDTEGKTERIEKEFTHNYWIEITESMF